MFFHIKQKVRCSIFIISVAESLKTGQKKIRHWFYLYLEENRLASHSFHLQEGEKGWNVNMCIKQRGTFLSLVQETQRIHGFTVLRPLSTLLQTPTIPNFWKKARGSKEGLLFQDTIAIFIKCSCHFLLTIFIKI